MKKNAYESAALQLRAAALESHVAIEALLTTDSGTDPGNIVKDIIHHAQNLAKCEGAMLTLQQYFGPKPAATPTPPPSSPRPLSNEPPIKVTEEMSPTYKKSVAKEKIKATARRVNAEAAAKKAKTKKGASKDEE